MRGKKTRYFGICIAVIAIMLGLMLACGGCLIYVYFARRDILETILARYYAMMGIEFTGIDMTSMWMEIIIYGLDIAILIYYLVKCAKFMKMTQEEFMKKNSKQILDVLPNCMRSKQNRFSRTGKSVFAKWRESGYNEYNSHAAGVSRLG